VLEAYKLFLKESVSIQQNVEDHFVDNFGKSFDEIIAKCINAYRLIANKYDQETAEDKYSQLMNKIESHIQHLFPHQLQHLISKCVEIYDKEIHKSFPKNECVCDFRNIIQNVSEKIRKYFSKQIEKCIVQTNNNEFLNKESHAKELNKRLRECTKSYQIKQLALLQKENDTLIEECLLFQVSKIMLHPNLNLWNDISLLRADYHDKILNNKLFKKLDYLMFEKETEEENKKKFSENVDIQIKLLCLKHTERIETVLIEQFDYYFHKDEKTKIPRDWNSSLKINDIFINAKKKMFRNINNF